MYQFIGIVLLFVSSNAQQLTWSDEFDGPAGQGPDDSKWTHEVNGDGGGNQELQYYTNSRSNSALDGQGHLVITARKENPSNYNCWYGRCQYTSARLVTKGKFDQKYGRFEARIKIPRGQGVWPAFWMLGNDIYRVSWPQCGELDIMENVGKEPNKVHGTLHGPGYSGGSGLTSTFDSPNGRPFADDFHIYRADWYADRIEFSVDGRVFSRRTPGDTRGNKWVFDHPFFVILNLAVGGQWPGSPDQSTQFPQTMVIDYVRAYTLPGGQGGQTPDDKIKIVSHDGGRCVDVPNGRADNWAQIQLWECNGSDAQKWTRSSDGTIRALGKCLDIKHGSTEDGANVQLFDCNGSSAQQWRLSPAGDIVNPQADKCLDVQAPGDRNGALLQLFTCHGRSNQKWTITG